MKNKLVSIIVTTLNEGKRLEPLFETIKTQTYKNLEVIISDSPKTNDDTKEIIQQWQSNFPITRGLNNMVLGKGRLEGAKLAKGEYLLQIDADMLLSPLLIEECVNLIDNGADAININEEAIGEGYWTRCKWLEKRCYFNNYEISSPRFFSKNAYFEVGGHNPKLALSEDKDIDLKFKKYKKIIKFSKNIINHNEGKISLKKTFKSKFYWSQTGFEYLDTQPVAAWKQVLLMFFRPAYLINFKLLLKYPHLTFGMYILKISELIGVILGGFGTKLGLIKKMNYKTTT